RYLSLISRMLSESLEYDNTIARTAQLLVPEVADGCVIRLYVDGVLKIVAIDHRNKDKLPHLINVAETVQLLKDTPSDLKDALIQGKPVVINQVKQVSSILQSVTETERPQLQHLFDKEFGLSSFALLPLRTHGKLIGTISLITDDSKRQYGQVDLTF